MPLQIDGACDHGTASWKLDFMSFQCVCNVLKEYVHGADVGDALALTPGEDVTTKLAVVAANDPSTTVTWNTERNALARGFLLFTVSAGDLVSMARRDATVDLDTGQRRQDLAGLDSEGTTSSAVGKLEKRPVDFMHKTRGLLPTNATRGVHLPNTVRINVIFILSLWVRIESFFHIVKSWLRHDVSIAASGLDTRDVAGLVVFLLVVFILIVVVIAGNIGIRVVLGLSIGQFVAELVIDGAIIASLRIPFHVGQGTASQSVAWSKVAVWVIEHVMDCHPIGLVVNNNETSKTHGW
ncbi:hypothetical protein HG531_011299 [Fusarium graminearum]|nr:hypothetical protein HG531_011299 [Fusarium graminearum]